MNLFPIYKLSEDHLDVDDNKIHYFKNLFILIQQFFNSEELNRICFDQLTTIEIKLLYLLLKKLFPVRISKNEITFNDMQELKAFPSKKRNEEKIKQIWKRFLRKIYDDFKFELSKEEKESCKKNKCSDKWKEFYSHIFKNLNQENGKMFNFDLIMDICTEQTIGIVNTKKPKKLGPNNNWKTLKKIAAMKKIPASFRYLISQSKQYLKKFKNYLNIENSKGIIILMKDIIQSKLKNLFCQWGKKFKELKYNEKQFLEEVENQIKKKKFKLPWLLSNVKDSIEYCLSDINHEKLPKKFKSIQQCHYSYEDISSQPSN